MVWTITPPLTTGQANHLGVTIEADIIKQKLPHQQWWVQGFEYWFIQLRQTRMSASTPSFMSDHPIDLTRYQVANCYMGRAGLINSVGQAVTMTCKKPMTAVINKRAGGTGLISGRKAFQRPIDEGARFCKRSKMSTWMIRSQ
ncbi:MAG: hypothetical protein R2688_00730 [Fimbriimonadaceae bacterium]